MLDKGQVAISHNSITAVSLWSGDGGDTMESAGPVVGAWDFLVPGNQVFFIPLLFWLNFFAPSSAESHKVGTLKKEEELEDFVFSMLA